MGLLSGRLGLKKLTFLQERDDWFSTSGAKRVPVPHANAGGHYSLSIFNYPLAEITFSDKHVRDTYVRGLTSSFLIRTAWSCSWSS